MKNLRLLVSLLLLLPLATLVQAQESQYIQWTGEDEIANALVKHGVHHWLNIENEKALTYFEAAVEKDPSLFAPHVALAMLTKGEHSDMHKEKARELVEGKNEVSRLFVSTLDYAKGKDQAAKTREIWAKMHQLGPDGRFIHFGYARSLEKPEDRIAEMEKLLAKNEKDERSTGHIHNILGYLYYGQGNKEQAKMHFKKYVELHPKGYNAYDSMGEFYLNEGNLEKAMKYYKKAVAQYPAARNAQQQLEKIAGMMNEAGNLIQVTTEYVHPEHMMDYYQWGEEYKALAEKTGYNTFWVSSTDGNFSYASLVGKTLADVEAHEKAWEEWVAANPELQEMYEKYKHSVSHTERSLWRHSPELSYQPAEPREMEEPGYVRTMVAYVKFGHEEQVKEVLADFQKTWTEKGITYPYAVYWNVFGEEGSCLAIRSVYADIANWGAERKEVAEKVGEEKLMELMSSWASHMRSWEENESFPIPALTHIKKDLTVASGN